MQELEDPVLANKTKKNILRKAVKDSAKLISNVSNSELVTGERENIYISGSTTI